MKKIILFVLLVNTCVCGLAKDQNDVDSIRITFTHLDGYGVYLARACYAYQNNVYKLQFENSSGLPRFQQFPMTISKENVSKLLNDCNLYSTEDRCEFIKITKHDYSNYIKIINDKDSLDYYLPLAYDFIFDFMKNLDAYKLKEDAFLSLSCSEIINIIESPIESPYYHKPLFKIELIGKKTGKITIGPQWYFDGTAWIVLSHGKTMFVANEYLMSFLKDIQYDKYVYFEDRFYLLFQIADVLEKHMREKENSSMYQIPRSCDVK